MIGAAWHGMRIAVIVLACLVGAMANQSVARAQGSGVVVGVTMCPPGESATDPHPVIALRGLQARLMVAALSCGLRDGYGDFVNRFSNQLAANADALKVRYQGRGGTRAVDRLVTRLANAAAQRSNADRAGFCAQAGQTMNRLALTTPADLNRLAVQTWNGMTCLGP